MLQWNLKAFLFEFVFRHKSNAEVATIKITLLTPESIMKDTEKFK